MFEVKVRDKKWDFSIFINGELADSTVDLQGVRAKGVFIHEDKYYIIKIGSQSQAEWFFLESIVEEADKSYFLESVQGGLAPRSDEDGYERGTIGYIIQEFVTFEKGRDLHLSHWNQIQYIIQKYGLRDLSGVDGDEGRNWGVVNGQPVIYDWGLGAHHDLI